MCFVRSDQRASLCAPSCCAPVHRSLPLVRTARPPRHLPHSRAVSGPNLSELALTLSQRSVVPTPRGELPDPSRPEAAFLPPELVTHIVRALPSPSHQHHPLALISTVWQHDVQMKRCARFHSACPPLATLDRLQVLELFVEATVDSRLGGYVGLITIDLTSEGREEADGRRVWTDDEKAHGVDLVHQLVQQVPKLVRLTLNLPERSCVASRQWEAPRLPGMDKMVFSSPVLDLDRGLLQAILDGSPNVVDIVINGLVPAHPWPTNAAIALPSSLRAFHSFFGACVPCSASGEAGIVRRAGVAGAGCGCRYRASPRPWDG